MKRIVPVLKAVCGRISWDPDLARTSGMLLVPNLTTPTYRPGNNVFLARSRKG